VHVTDHLTATIPPADDGDSDDSDSDEESAAGKGGDEVGAARWAARLTAMRGFKRVTMPAVVGADLANPLAAEIWALHPWKDVPAAELETSADFLQKVVAHKGVTSPGHVSFVAYLDEVGDGKRASVDAADLEKLKKILKPLECEGTMATHACSGVGYPRRRWTRERTERLLSELLAIVEGTTTTAEEKREAARVAVLGATEWAFFRPHTDGHWRIRERVTVAAAVRMAAPLATAVRADAERSKDAQFDEAARRLETVLAQLGAEHGFAPPTAPGLRFGTRGRACESGYLGWPRDFKAGEGGWPAGLFSTEAQALDTVHWRVPPAGGTRLPDSLGPTAHNPEAGERSWRPDNGDEYIFDAFCALSFVAWLWPTLLREQLAVQPTFPDFIGPTLVVAAGRASFAPNALGGLLEACRAVPLELFSPDGTCSTADELVRWRRCISADGKRPAEALPREGRAQEFDWARTELPPIDMGQVGAAAAAAGALRSCAGARLREGARGGGASSGEGTSGGAGGSKGAGKRRREGVALDRDANTGGRTDDLITRRLWFNLAPCTRACH
jgi:hypothetical protein